MEQQEIIEKGFDKIRYKYSVPGWYLKIDITTGQPTEFNQKNSGLHAEMQEWLTIDGNVIEEQFTAEEQAVKDQAEIDAALETQNQTILNLLDESDKKVSGAYPNTTAEKTEWKTWRAALRVIYKSGTVQTISDKPYGG